MKKIYNILVLMLFISLILVQTGVANASPDMGNKTIGRMLTVHSWYAYGYPSQCPSIDNMKTPQSVDCILNVAEYTNSDAVEWGVGLNYFLTAKGETGYQSSTELLRTNWSRFNTSGNWSGKIPSINGTSGGLVDYVIQESHKRNISVIITFTYNEHKVGDRLYDGFFGNKYYPSEYKNSNPNNPSSYRGYHSGSNPQYLWWEVSEPVPRAKMVNLAKWIADNYEIF